MGRRHEPAGRARDSRHAPGRSCLHLSQRRSFGHCWFRVSPLGRPDDPKNPKSAVADLEYAGRLDPPTTLAEIKLSKQFDDWALVRQGRLSTMPVPEKFVAWMRTRYPKAKL